MNKIDTEYTFRITLPEYGYEVRAWVYADKYSEAALLGHTQTAITVIDEFLKANKLADDETIHDQIRKLASAVLEIVDFSAVEVISKKTVGSFGEVWAEIGRAGIVLYKNWSTTI